jgi:predicted transposase YbfD/YdcC
VDCKSNEIKALPPAIKALAERGVVFAFDALNTKKTCEKIITSKNHCLVAIKGNHGNFLKAIKAQFNSIGVSPTL